MTRSRSWTEEQLARFLDELSCTGDVVYSARVAGIAQTVLYELKNTSVEFAERWQQAIENAIDHLEGAAIRRALQGDKIPQFYQGQQIGEVRSYSDRLAIFLLSAHRPGLYGKTRGRSGGPEAVDAEIDPKEVLEARLSVMAQNQEGEGDGGESE